MMYKLKEPSEIFDFVEVNTDDCGDLLSFNSVHNGLLCLFWSFVFFEELFALGVLESSHFLY